MCDGGVLVQNINARVAKLPQTGRHFQVIPLKLCGRGASLQCITVPRTITFNLYNPTGAFEGAGPEAVIWKVECAHRAIYSHLCLKRDLFFNYCSPSSQRPKMTMHVPRSCNMSGADNQRTANGFKGGGINLSHKPPPLRHPESDRKKNLYRQ